MHPCVTSSTPRRLKRRSSVASDFDRPDGDASTRRAVEPEDEQAALEACRAVSRGDSAALGPLYIRYAKLVRALALAILGSREEAEDLAQEVFVSLCGRTTYDPGRGSMRAFLTTVTRSRAIDRLRSRARSARLLAMQLDATEQAPTLPFESVSMERTAERVRAVLAELPETQRNVLEMAYYRGLSQREIACALELPLGTVKTWSRRALFALERALAAQ